MLSTSAPWMTLSIWWWHSNDCLLDIDCTVLFFLFLFLYLVSYLITFPQSVKSNPIRISSRSWILYLFSRNQEINIWLFEKQETLVTFSWKMFSCPERNKLLKQTRYVKFFLNFKMITEGWVEVWVWSLKAIFVSGWF